MGAFAEWVRTHRFSHRSDDPCYSVAAIGARSAEFTMHAPQNSFGPDSFFDRFYKAGGKVLNFNFDAGSTFIHYVERCLAVPYRFDKTFHGQILKSGELHSSSSTIWVRYLSDDALEFDSKPFSQLATDQSLFHRVTLGRGQIGLISAIDSYSLIAETLPKRPWFLTRAEAMGVSKPHIVHEK
jgi:aminoglycoside 3-N-acetyltransferase